MYSSLNVAYQPSLQLDYILLYLLKRQFIQRHQYIEFCLTHANLGGKIPLKTEIKVSYRLQTQLIRCKHICPF